MRTFAIAKRGRDQKMQCATVEEHHAYFEKASRIRQIEAQKARDNRAEIVKALSLSQITRRDPYKWGF